MVEIFSLISGLSVGGCLGYLSGFERGIRFKTTGEAAPLPSVRPLVSFGRKEKRKPKSISDEELYMREQKRPPADPT